MNLRARAGLPLAAASLAALALVVAGSGAARSAPATTAAPAATAGATVTLNVWDQEVRGGQAEAIKKLNAQFQKQYPNIKIKRTAKSFTDLLATLKLAASGPNPPDVVEANNGYSAMGPLVQANLLLPLDAYSQKNGWRTRYSPGILRMNRFTARRQELRPRQPVRPADDGRGRRRLLQQGEAAGARAGPADDVRRVRGRAREGEGGRRDADPVRQPRQVAGHPHLRGADAPVRHEGLRPLVDLRRGRPELRDRRHPARRDEAAGVGAARATSRTATRGSATTRRGRSSARATASS